MWKDVVDALKWIADTLLKRHRESSQDKRQKWLQVAEYLETVARLIDAAAEDFKNSRIPHGHYEQLCNIVYEFPNVLSQVYGSNELETVRHYSATLKATVTTVYENDAYMDSPTLADAMFAPKRSQKIELTKQEKQQQNALVDLQATAGRFRGLAMTIKAKA